jgi:DNA repair exonuclease SbcCD ATPase subunit
MKTISQTQLEALETRATELRQKRDDAAAASAALDARLASGEFDRAGDAANKRAELDAIGRALDGVEADADAVRGQIAEQGAAAARAAEVLQLRNVARDILILDADAQNRALLLVSELETKLEEIELAREAAHALRQQFRAIRSRDRALITEALSQEIQSAIGYSSHERWAGFDPRPIFPGRNSEIGNAIETAIGSAIVKRAQQRARTQNNIPRPRAESIFDAHAKQPYEKGPFVGRENSPL